MANEDQVAILEQGVDVWNRWREDNPDIEVDLMDLWCAEANLENANLRGAKLGRSNFSHALLYGADLRRTELGGTNFDSANLVGTNLTSAFSEFRPAHFPRATLSDAKLSQVNLKYANLRGANLSNADLSEAYLYGANFDQADLFHANLQSAYLSKARLYGANLLFADLQGANLRGANLQSAALVKANIDKAEISGSLVRHVNVWELEGEFAEQKDLVITWSDEPLITVDNIKIAQFIYLILNNEEIRDVFNALTSKTVLILGRFAIPERKEILDALRNKLREYNLLPIVFDFDRPTDKDFTETIKTLAGLSYFVIADVTNPKSSPLELQATVPDYQIPFVPIIQAGERPFAMMEDLQKKYDWVLETRTYSSKESLIKGLKKGIILPAMEKHKELRLIKAQDTESLSLDEMGDEE